VVHNKDKKELDNFDLKSLLISFSINFLKNIKHLIMFFLLNKNLKSLLTLKSIVINY